MGPAFLVPPQPPRFVPPLVVRLPPFVLISSAVRQIALALPAKPWSGWQCGPASGHRCRRFVRGLVPSSLNQTLVTPSRKKKNDRDQPCIPRYVQKLDKIGDRTLKTFPVPFKRTTSPPWFFRAVPVLPAPRSVCPWPVNAQCSFGRSTSR